MPATEVCQPPDTTTGHGTPDRLPVVAIIEHLRFVEAWKV
jgi:hypothetical protein